MSAIVPSHRFVHWLVEVILPVVIIFDSAELHTRMRKVGVILSSLVLRKTTSTIRLLFLFIHLHVLLMLLLVSLVPVILEIVTMRLVIITSFTATEVLLLTVLLLLIR